jgi:hypothetical protein
MTTIFLPVTTNDRAPELPELEPRNPNWMGKIVQTIRSFEHSGIIQKVFIYTITLFVSLFLVTSIIFSPLFIYGFKEYIRQSERSAFDKRYLHLLNIATEHGKHRFLTGRLAPLDNVRISLGWGARKQMIRDLELSPDEAGKMKDIDLVRCVAIKYDNYIKRYNITIRA